MNQEAIRGTPPQIWKKLTHGAKGEMWAGLVRDQARIARLCRQIEKLSWMLEWMDDFPVIEEAEEAWKER